MKSERSLSPAWIVLLVIIILAIIPFAVWRADKGTLAAVCLSEPVETGEVRAGQLMWPPLYRKAVVRTNTSAPDAGNSVCILAEPVPSDFSDAEALTAVDMVKNSAFGSRAFISDGYTMTETTHALFRSSMSSFLQIRDTGWVVQYERAEPPYLLLQNTEGVRIKLEAGKHFDGKAPSAVYNGRTAPVFTWIPVYSSIGSTKTAVSVDLHLSPEGRAVFLEHGVAPEIPLIMENKSPLIHTAFFTADISHSPVAVGTHTVAGKLLYRSMISLFFPGSDDALYWRVWAPWVDSFLKANPADSSAGNRTVAQSSFTAADGGFTISAPVPGAQPEPFYVKGVNLGTALPGTWSTEFPLDEHLYYGWFSHMKEINLNTVRVYTLLPPAFYRALRRYNENNPDDPLYLLQEIWPEEHPLNNDYLAEEYDENYRNEIKLTIDALHGSRSIAPRSGRAWGEYASDVSPWTAAYLIGRELEPDEVLETDRLHPGQGYTGRWVSAPQGPAAEAWLAQSCDTAVAYETETYGESRPVGIVSWPILDALHHQVEWSDPELNGREPMNDKAVIDINRMVVEDPSFGGLFGAYHIYPNYPDFMNNEASYAEYRDGQGVFRYGGYLKDFMGIHKKYPALVAEYGISTSAATAHINPDGYNHGGLSETAQAGGIIRMSEAIRHEGYAGAMIFEWIDEWAKKTWTTEPFMVPFDRQALWHNALDPEQNYGITAMRASSVRGLKKYRDDSSGLEFQVSGSESHLNIHIPSEGLPGGAGKILIGFDIYDRAAGIRKFPGAAAADTPTGMECLAVVDTAAGSAEVLAADNYNIGTLAFSSGSGTAGSFVPEQILVNRAWVSEDGRHFAPEYTDLGRLTTGPLDETLNSYRQDSAGITIRVPWGLLNVSDPSGGTVLDDAGKYNSPPGRDVLGTAQSEGIIIYLLVQAEGGEEILFPDDASDWAHAPVFEWQNWNVPVYVNEDKKSVQLLSEYFGGF